MIVRGVEKAMSLGVRGKLGFCAAAGFARCGYSRAGAPKEYGGIYQKRATSKGKQVSRTRYYRPTNPQTEAQQAWRAKMAEMWGVYNSLTPEEKLALSKKARRYKLSGPQLFASRYLKSVSA